MAVHLVKWKCFGCGFDSRLLHCGLDIEVYGDVLVSTGQISKTGSSVGDDRINQAKTINANDSRYEEVLAA